METSAKHPKFRAEIGWIRQGEERFTTVSLYSVASFIGDIREEMASEERALGELLGRPLERVGGHTIIPATQDEARALVQSRGMM